MSDTSLEPITVRVTQAAELTGLSKWTIYKWADAQKIESRYEGVARLIVWESLKKHIESLPTERQEPVA